MNFKTHKKGLIALALVFFMIVPMLMAAVPVLATGSATGNFTVVQDSSTNHGSGYNPQNTTITSVTVPSSPNPVGTALAFDIMINNAANVDGWSIPTVSWNPAVLTLTNVKEGSFLADSGSGTDFLVGAILSGHIGGGISDAIASSAQSPDSQAVCCTLFFTVVGYGSSQVNIIDTGSNQAYLHTTSASNDPAIPVPAADASVTVQAPPLSISLFAHGTTSGSTITPFPSSQNPIGSTFGVDAYIVGAIGNVWGWSLNVAWNTAVLNCTGVTEGSYLSANGPAPTLFAAGNINNVLGLIQGGVNDAYNNQSVSSAGAGVLMTLNFMVVGYGSSNIALTAGSPAALLGNASVPTPLTNQPTLNNLQYIWTPQPPTAPTAIVSISSGPVPGTLITYTNDGITLSAASSTGGINQQPPNQACPITAWSWNITLTNGQQITANTQTVTLTSAQVGQTVGTIMANLTVIAPSPTNTPAPTYVNTTTVIAAIQVEQAYPGGVLDIWTQNGGQGLGQNASCFAPQQLVNLSAYVSFNGLPVVGKTVTFNVYSSTGVYLGSTTASTDQTGIATTSYRLPWQDNNPTQYFGVITITGAVDVSEVTLTDNCSFYYGWDLQLMNVQITNGITTINGQQVNVFNRYTPGSNVIDVTATVQSRDWNYKNFWLEGVILDNNSVPVAQFLTEETAPNAAAGGNVITTNSQTYTFTLTLPTWAFAGPATLYVNIFNGSPMNYGVVYSPQITAPLIIQGGNEPTSNAPNLVVSATYKVVGDEDTGLAGYWAIDNYTKTIQVWQTAPNTYEIVATYNGTWTTFSGTTSPENSTMEPATATGTLTGAYIGTFTATNFNASATNTIGTQNFGGTQSDIVKGTYSTQLGNTNSFDVINYYFPGYSNFNYLQWGWTYTYTNGLTIPSTSNGGIWNNFATGNTGNIVT